MAGRAATRRAAGSATRAAAASAAGISHSTLSGVTAPPDRPDCDAKACQAQRPAASAERYADHQGGDGDRRGLPERDRAQLATAQAEDLEYRVIAAPAAGRGDGELGEHAEAEHREHAGQHRRCAVDGRVVVHRVRPLAGDQAGGLLDAGAERRPAALQRREPRLPGLPGAEGDQREVVARLAAVGRELLLRENGRDGLRALPGVGGREAALAEVGEHRAARDEHRPAAFRGVHGDVLADAQPELAQHRGAEDDLAGGARRPAVKHGR